MHFKKFIRKIAKIEVTRLFLSIVVLFIAIYITTATNKTMAGICECDFQVCRSPPLSACSAPTPLQSIFTKFNDPDNICSASDTCLNLTNSTWIPCSTCPTGNYGDSDYRETVWNYCTDDCSSSVPASCDRRGPESYICDPTNTGNLVFQAWQDNNQYSPNNPTSRSANYVTYVERVRFKSPPGAFCPHWYTEQFTGYVWLEGEKELRIITDDNLAVSKKPTSSQCCRGNADHCGKCEKRWSLAYGCNKTSKSQCFKGHGCQWVVWNQSRCSDDYSDNTGVKIGYTFDVAKGKNVPTGEITDTGDPVGLSHVFYSGWGTRLRDQRFDGNSNEFEAGWYPIQAWYTRSNSDTAGYHTVRPGPPVVKIPNISYPIEKSDNERFDLQWRDPSGAGSFENVPSSSFTPCISAVACGAVPGAATGPATPANGAQDVPMPVTVGWNAPADWGETCGVQTNTYTVYARQRAGGACLDPSPADYTALPTCTNIAEGTTTCSDPFFNTRDTEFCWYVETNNGEFSTLSAANGGEVWWFETEDPITFQEWMTTLYGDFYAGSVIMEFPDVADQVAPWNPPHISFERNPADSDTTDVSAISSNDIDIATDHPKAGTLYFPESQSDFYVKYAAFTETWPPSYRGTPPATAVEINSNCASMFNGTLDPYITYKADVSCVNTGIAALGGGSYSFAIDGVAILYVTGSGDLRFDDVFTATNANTRILFVTSNNVDVKVDRSLNSGNVDFSSTPLIEAAFVVLKSFEFEGVPVGNDPETDPDTSIVVEGPIITKSILLSRNRGLTNAYPSEVVKYSPYYLYKLTNQERNSTESNYSGLFEVDVDWIIEK